MANNKKGSVLLIVAALAALVGLIIYLVTSFTGYLAGSAPNMLPVIFSVLALVLIAAVYVTGGKLPALCVDVLLVAAAALLIVSFSAFTLARVPLAADVYFIPVNYPAAEETALHISIAGMVFYVISILMMIVDGFVGKE